VNDLQERTDYEAWLLEAVYEIVDEPVAVSGVDHLVYPPTGGPPDLFGYGAANVTLGDWRPGFLQAGAPLVLVTAFKLLDMLIEWILAQNRVRATHRFTEKISALKRSIHFPRLINTRPWLQERLIALYEHLEPLRGTIVHNRHFKRSVGGLQVSRSKGATIGPTITFAAADLRNLAVVLVSILRYLEGTWTMDLFREKRVRRALDEIAHLHTLPSLGQLPPSLASVRWYVVDEDPIRCDIARVRTDLAAMRQGQDVLFGLRIIAVSRDGTRGVAYVVPWHDIQQFEPQFCKSRHELALYATVPPADIDLPAIARELNLRS